MVLIKLWIPIWVQLAFAAQPLCLTYYTELAHHPKPALVSPGKFIFATLDGPVRKAQEERGLSHAAHLLEVALADAGYEVRHSVHTFHADKLSDPQAVQTLLDSQHGGLRRQTVPSGLPMVVHVPKVRILRNGKEFTVSAALLSATGAEKEALMKIERQAYRVAHEETFHAAQYNGHDKANPPFLPLTIAFAKEKPRVEALIDDLDLPAHAILPEIEYLEYVLTVSPSPGFQTRQELAIFLDKWRFARYPAVEFFLSQPGFDEKVEPKTLVFLKQIMEDRKTHGP